MNNSASFLRQVSRQQGTAHATTPDRGTEDTGADSGPDRTGGATYGWRDDWRYWPAWGGDKETSQPLEDLPVSSSASCSVLNVLTVRLVNICMAFNRRLKGRRDLSFQQKQSKH